MHPLKPHRPLPGALNLGLAPRWQFGFLEAGQPVTTTPGVLFLGLGERTAPGILDRAPGIRASVAEQLVMHPGLAYNHLLDPWLAATQHQELAALPPWAPRIVLPSNAGWDVLIAVHLAIRLIEDGWLPDYAPSLAGHATDVLHGRVRLDPSDPTAFFAPHLAHLVIRRRQDLDETARLTAGLALLERVVADVAAAVAGAGWSGRHLLLTSNPAATRWHEDRERFGPIADTLLGESERLAQDRSRGTIMDAVELPRHNGPGTCRVRAFVADEPLESPLTPALLRAAGVPLTVAPSSAILERLTVTTQPVAGVFPRVTVLLDPDFATSDGDRPALRGLGFSLEQAESRCRLTAGGPQRAGPPRWDDGSCDNADPWYDGRNHDWTLVDAPRGGTELPYAEIRRVLLETPFWERPVVGGTVVGIWTRQPDHALDEATPIPPFPGMVETLGSFCADSRVQTLSEVSGAPWESRLLRFPPGTCGTFLLRSVQSTPGATLEGLLRTFEKAEDGPPSYLYARLALSPAAPFTEPIDGVLGTLGFDMLTAVDGIQSSTAALHNSRALVILASPHAPTPDPALAVFLYTAFVNETLRTMSSRIGAAIPEAGQSLETVQVGHIRTDLLRFQARYYQLEASDAPHSRLIHEALVRRMRIIAHYEEVGRELQQLGDLEQACAEAEAAAADRTLQLALYVVAVLGVFDVAIAFTGMEPSARGAPWFVGMCGLITVAAAGVWWRVSRRHPRAARVRADPREPATRHHSPTEA